MAKAVAYVEGFAKEVKPGEIYDGEVVRLMNFGAFVKYFARQRRHGSCNGHGPNRLC